MLHSIGNKEQEQQKKFQHRLVFGTQNYLIWLNTIFFNKVSILLKKHKMVAQP